MRLTIVWLLNVTWRTKIKDQRTKIKAQTAAEGTQCSGRGEIALAQVLLVGAALLAISFIMLLLGSLSAIAVMLAMVGTYGVISFSVGGRTQEIGIRLALGARTADVMRMVLSQGMRVVLIGIVIGVGAAFALTRLLSSLLFEVSPTDTTTFLIVAALLSSVAMLACYIPARRATKVDPLIALRYE